MAVAISTAYAEHAGALRGYLARRIRDDGAAEDLVQETFIRLLTECAESRPPAHPRAWLFRVATNLATSRGRRLQVASRRAADLIVREVVASPEDELLEREAAHALRGRLRDLPAHVRRALLLTAEGFSGAEVARSIGRSELATRSLICRYRSRLRAAA